MNTDFINNIITVVVKSITEFYGCGENISIAIITIHTCIIWICS